MLYLAKRQTRLSGESGREEKGKEKARSVLIKPYPICPRALVFAYVHSQSAVGLKGL